MPVFHKLCRTAQSSAAHRTKSASATGLSVSLSVTRLRAASLCKKISERIDVLPGCLKRILLGGPNHPTAKGGGFEANFVEELLWPFVGQTCM